ncbi:hypothetical protein niasHT_030540 [Heterodera trifolii]|uniref:Battenin n=1 Tax=Heterodera trifolii TaxID=157864 RepID=A0ABD2IYE0_9BILA
MISAQFSLAVLLLLLLTFLHLSSPANARPQWYYADPISMANNRGTLFDNLWGRNSTLLAWFFGTGASGIVSSVTYSALTEPKLFGISPQKVILSMLIIPTVYFLTYWLVLVHSPLMHKAQLSRPSSWIVPAIRRPNCSGQPLLRYMVPICIVYFLDNLINSGLLQHVKFDCAHSFGLSLASQFRWLQTFHLIGIFLSRLSAIFVEMPSLIFYSLPFLMLANLAIFFGQALFRFIPHILFVFVTIFIMGMVNGACCNFFGKIHQQASPMAREFKMTVISLADTSGVAMAGFLSILAHNGICQLYPIIYP